MRSSRAVVAGVLAAGVLALAPPQAADAHHGHAADDPTVISDWNRIGVATIAADGPRKQAIEVYLYMAFMHAAVYNAVVGIEGGYRPYRFHVRAPRHASSQAAAAAAAHRVLVTYSPDQSASLDDAYAASLAAIPDGREKTRGVAYGELAAADVISDRLGDGRNAPITFTQSPAPGVWRPTPPSNVPFSAPWLGFVSPLMLHSGDQFDPGPQPAMSSAEYTRDFNEVKDFGSIDSTVRTAEMTATATFFSGNPVVQFTTALRDQAAKRNLDIAESAQLFAATHLSMADASIAIWWTKYHYGFWRPLTAIRLADTDDNPGTTADPAWRPAIEGMPVPLPARETPPYPDYVSGYNGVMGAFTQALQDSLGTRHLDLDLISTAVPGEVRSYDLGREVRQEVIDARVWLGLHFRFADTAAARMGRQVAHFGLEENLQPTGHDHR
jgi:hypothetical protein